MKSKLKTQWHLCQTLAIVSLWIVATPHVEADLILKVDSANDRVALTGSGTTQIPALQNSVYTFGNQTGTPEILSLGVSSSSLTAELRIYADSGLKITFQAGDSDGVSVVGSGVGTAYSAGAYETVIESFIGSSTAAASGGTDVGPLSVASAVPEPSAFVLSALVTVVMCSIRRRPREQASQELRAEASPLNNSARSFSLQRMGRAS